MEYKHILITRLNAFYKQKMPTHGYDPDEWLIGRVRLFKEYCFPSVVNQSSADFEWILYIDSQTPVQVVEELKELFLPHRNFHLLQRKFDDFAIHPHLDNDIREIAEINFNYLITTRLDTDDMIHKDYIAKIQKSFERKEYLPINFNNGYIYNIYTGVTAKVNYPYNPFLSLISKIENNIELVTIFHRMHHEFQDDLNVKRINTKEPMWCMTISEYNYSTGFFGRVLFKRDKKFGDYFAPQKVINPSFFTILSAKGKYYLRIFEKVKLKLIGKKA